MLKVVHHNSANFNVDESNLRPFEKFVLSLEGQVLEGRIFLVSILFGYKNAIEPCKNVVQKISKIRFIMNYFYIIFSSLKIKSIRNL